ncbi:MAG: metal dependent phosphohydrolase [Gammaproteobacteria bacterium]|nr:MAG: metal dependent phosphohydrolase [Gammaproteobacteria bacterium]TND04298.1 MAG: metal dependent phosphohydrolase [Gammaproteobacteria bacterium]
MYQHNDALSELNNKKSLSEKLQSVHGVLKHLHDCIARIAVAVYDPKTDLIKTFIHSSGDTAPLSHYQAKLSESHSLQEIVSTRRSRVVNDMSVFADGSQEHTRRIAQTGYGSSYTMPMFQENELFGFIFFNSFEKDVMKPELLYHLDLFGHLIMLVVINDLNSVRTLLSTIKAARDMTNFRDMETGSHLDRMSRFARLIAREIADKHGFDDEFIERIFRFSPLHDIGKIGVPDRILQKPAPLSDEEWVTMKTHAYKGREIIDTILADFGLGSAQHMNVLRNIAELHHETMDGSGYPHGLTGQQIPIEARIVAVADVFDALTSKRPYKERWSNDDAFRMLDSLAGTRLDADCVNALVSNRAEVERIQAQFDESHYG